MQKPIKRIIAIMLAAVCVFLSACTDKAQETEAFPNGTLLIGSDIYSPYFYLGDDGSFTGIDVEIATEACRRLGMKAEFQQISWQNKEEYLEEGAIDCLWGSFSMNGREEDYAWAGPYMHSKQVVAVLKSSDIYKLKDLNGKRISVQNGSKPDGLFSADAVKGVSVKRVYTFATMSTAFAALKKGYVDACAGHETALRDYIKNVSGDYQILDEFLLAADLGVAFQKESGQEQAEQLAAVLNEMKSDGTIRKILEGYDLDIDFAIEGASSDEEQ